MGDEDHIPFATRFRIHTPLAELPAWLWGETWRNLKWRWIKKVANYEIFAADRFGLEKLILLANINRSGGILLLGRDSLLAEFNRFEDQILTSQEDEVDETDRYDEAIRWNDLDNIQMHLRYPGDEIDENHPQQLVKHCWGYEPQINWRITSQYLPRFAALLFATSHPQGIREAIPYVVHQKYQTLQFWRHTSPRIVQTLDSTYGPSYVKAIKEGLQAVHPKTRMSLWLENRFAAVLSYYERMEAVQTRLRQLGEDHNIHIDIHSKFPSLPLLECLVESLEATDGTNLLPDIHIS